MHTTGTRPAEGISNRPRFAKDYTKALHIEVRSEILILIAALIGIMSVAYADGIVQTISLGYLYVLPLSLAALTRYRRVTYLLIAVCVLLHDLLGPYMHSDWQRVYVSTLSLVGFTVVVLFVGKLSDQRRRLMQVVSDQRKELELELVQAAEIQKRLLPQESPAIPCIDIAGLMSPSKELGGDYYDYIQLPEGNLGLVIADVSGKGVEAALFMPSIEVALRMDAHSPLPTDEVIANLNRVLYELTAQTRYATLFYAKLDVRQGTLEYTNAGHFPPVILREGQPDKWLTEGGPVVGLLPDAGYCTATVALNPGDILILYTDGVIDAENEKEEMFSAERLVTVARAHRSQNAPEMLQSIQSSVSAFTGGVELRDDFTLVVLKMLPPPATRPSA